MKPVVKNVLMTSLLACVVIYMVICLINTGRQTQNRICQKVNIHITDADERQFISEKDVKNLLLSQGIMPVGKAAGEIDAQAIENAIKSHPMVRKAECYKSNNGDTEIRLSQREPLLKVVTESERYFVDTDHKVMPVSETMKTDVLRVSGHVGRRMACEELADMAEWLQDNRYWSHRVKEVRVNNPKYVILKQTEGRADIILGATQRYEQKLAKLKIWYEKGQKEMEWKEYREMDLRYYGQVIGRN